jgi:hypothetical protein
MANETKKLTNHISNRNFSGRASFFLAINMMIALSKHRLTKQSLFRNACKQRL